MSHEILAIIPARGGSKGIPGKNIKMLAGKPMISYIIETAKGAEGVSRVIVSTDNAEIAATARNFGAEVPFLRPSALAEDHVPTLPVLQHALTFLRQTEGYEPDYVLLVYPTSPLLKKERVEEAIRIACATHADSVVSGTQVSGHYWQKSEKGYHRLYPLHIENRQRTAPIFKENGAVYLMRTSILVHQIVADAMTPLFMDDGENIDVDTIEDFNTVERIMAADNQKK